jgi:hypothetical protein
MFERQQLTREAPQCARGGDGLSERLLAEPSAVPVGHPGFPFYLV